MNRKFRNTLGGLVALAWSATALQAEAAVNVQCPGDTNGDAVIDAPNPAHPNARCMHLAAGDGWSVMADGKSQYIFGFSDVTGTPSEQVMQKGALAANLPAPPIALEQGQELYLTLSNVGMLMRPDLFDPHSIHFHGFPNAAPVFDGEPEAGISANMGASFTYYYNIVEPGTYVYHCHVEAAEHMQMGMLGSLYVRAGQNKLPAGTVLTGGLVHQPSYQYAYNDGDGSTRYDKEYALQLASFDSNFHDLHIAVQPLPFAYMKDNYSMINGRSYPDTVNTGVLPQSPDNSLPDKLSQKVNSLVEATRGQKVLLRLSNLSITNFYTVTALGLPMKVVGSGARILRAHNPDGSPVAGGKTLYYDTASVNLGGGETADILIDTTNVAPGTYYLYTTNLNYLSNGPEDNGGIMTEIVVN